MIGEKKVLLVDDDPGVSWGLGRFLTRQSWNVTICGDGVEALQLLEEETFQALVTDVQMPRLNGIALVDWAKRNRPEMTIIVITAFGSSSVRKVCFQKGAFHYLEKPVDPGLLVELLSVNVERDTFSGTVTCVDMFDYVQMLLVSRGKMIVELQSVDSEKGMFFIDSGDVVHAECAGMTGEMTGERAFFHCLSFHGGSFSTLPWQEPQQRTIKKRGNFLLMDAAREKDETARFDVPDAGKSTSGVVNDDNEISFDLRMSIIPANPDSGSTGKK